MIATGTDVKPIEVLIFLRDVKSELYFEQMKGRGVRTIDADRPAAVTPDAEAKTRFILIDAVGVTESQKTVSQPLERDRTIAFDKLLDQVAAGRRDDDAFPTLAARLAALDRRIDDERPRRDRQGLGRHDLADLASRLIDAIDPDALAKRGPRTRRKRIRRRRVRRRKTPPQAVFDEPQFRRPEGGQGRGRYQDRHDFDRRSHFVRL